MEDNYYVNPANTIQSKLEIPLVPLVNCQWRSNGCYFDNNSVLDVSTLDASYALKGNFIENLYTPAGNMNNQYIVNRLDRLVMYKEEVDSIRNLLISNEYKGFIKKYLSNNEKIDTAIGYYNPYVQSLSFIYYGLTFVYSLSNAQYKNEIKLNEYDNFEIYIINESDDSTKNEMFIDTDDEFILIINHVNNTDNRFSNNDIKLFNKDGNIVNSPYAWYNAPYCYNMVNTAKIFNNVYLQKSKDITYTDRYAKYVIEMDRPIYDDPDVDFGEDPVYMYFSMGSNYTMKGIYDTLALDANGHNSTLVGLEINNDPDVKDLTFKTDLSKILDVYKKGGAKRRDYRKKDAYILDYDDNIHPAYTINDMMEKYIESFEDADMDMYILSNDAESYKLIEVNAGYRPVILNIERPIRIKFNQGLFDPEFVDIVDFEVNDIVSKKIDIDTLYANTQIREVKGIPMYYYNKILDMGASCDYNYYSVPSRSILATCWDNDVYRLYANDVTYKNVKGYSIGIIDKMLFGSMGLRLRCDGLQMYTWNYGPENYSANSLSRGLGGSQQIYTIYLNLTKTFYNCMMDETPLMSNWDCTGDVTNIRTYVSNYIDNVLIKLFDFSNINIMMYKQAVPGASFNLTQQFVKEKPDDFHSYVIYDNIETTVSEVNKEYIVKINIPYENNALYYPFVKINRI